jgi:hypothetical protein
MEFGEWAAPSVWGWMSLVLGIIAPQIGAIIPEPGSRRLMAGSITNGLKQDYTSFFVCCENASAEEIPSGFGEYYAIPKQSKRY